MWERLLQIDEFNFSLGRVHSHGFIVHENFQKFFNCIVLGAAMSVADWMALFPCDVASREVVVDWLYQKFLDNLFWHAPCQRCSLRRSQLSWWTPECFATCVARNGVITVCSDHIPSDSALGPSVLLVALARPCCQVLPHAPSCCRFHRSTAASRGNPSVQVRFPSVPDRALSQHEILDGWRTHFSSVGSRGSTFGDAFFQSISAWFDEVVSSPNILALFDDPFSSSELRHALTQCVDSAVGLDGLPYFSLRPTSLWQEAMFSFLNLTLA